MCLECVWSAFGLHAIIVFLVAVVLVHFHMQGPMFVQCVHGTAFGVCLDLAVNVLVHVPHTRIHMGTAFGVCLDLVLDGIVLECRTAPTGTVP